MPLLGSMFIVNGKGERCVFSQSASLTQAGLRVKLTSFPHTVINVLQVKLGP